MCYFRSPSRQYFQPIRSKSKRQQLDFNALSKAQGHLRMVKLYKQTHVLKMFPDMCSLSCPIYRISQQKIYFHNCAMKRTATEGSWFLSLSKKTTKWLRPQRTKTSPTDGLGEGELPSNALRHNITPVPLLCFAHGNQMARSDSHPRCFLQVCDWYCQAWENTLEQ